MPDTMIADMIAKPPRPKPMPSDKLPKDIDLSRLSNAIDGARLALQPYRENRHKFVREYVGFRYSNDGSHVPVPVNLIGLYVDIMSSALVSKTPRVMLSTPDQKQRAAVSASEGWANQEAEDMYLADMLWRVVVDALFLFGVVKVGICDPGHAAVKGWNYKSGTPFADRIDPEDFVVDMNARDIREASFIGHRYRVPLEVARKIYRDGRKFEGEELSDFNEYGDEKIGVIARGTKRQDEFEEHVTLWEIYLPRHKLVLTFADDQGLDRPADQGMTLIRTQKWVGPECGPYQMLGFRPVPGSPIPKAPIMDLFELHWAVNNLYRKLIQQGVRQKTVLPVRGGAVDDAGKLKEVSDGEMFQCDNAAELQEVSYGGPNQGVFLLAQHLTQLFSWLAGNLDIVGGLSPQAKTAKQEEQLNQNSGRAVGDKQNTVVNFISEVFKSLTWFWWNHPEKIMETEYRAPGAPEASIVRRVGPYDSAMPLRRDGEMPKVKVDPYSLSHTTPQQRLSFIMGFVQQMQPMLGLLSQQGIMFDAPKFIELVAKYGDEADLTEIFTVQEPLERQGGDGGGEPGMPAQTERTYTRRSLGQNSQQAQAANMETALEAGGESGFGKALGA